MKVVDADAIVVDLMMKMTAIKATVNRLEKEMKRVGKLDAHDETTLSMDRFYYTMYDKMIDILNAQPELKLKEDIAK